MKNTFFYNVVSDFYNAAAIVTICIACNDMLPLKNQIVATFTNSKCTLKLPHVSAL